VVIVGPEERETIELQNHRAMIELPENTVALTLTAKVYYEGELVTVGKEYSISEIRAMFHKADMNYAEDDDLYTMTEEGKMYFDEMIKRLKK
jgi:hypothetical protein